jgi:hypothetical protein
MSDEHPWIDVRLPLQDGGETPRGADPRALSPEAQALIAAIALRHAPRPDVAKEASAAAAGPELPAIVCDTCGLRFTDPHAKGRKQLLDNAKFSGWQERRRYKAMRVYCPEHARGIRDREEARGKRR